MLTHSVLSGATCALVETLRSAGEPVIYLMMAMLQKAKKIWHGCWPRMEKADDVAARLWCAFGEGRQGCDCDCLTSSIAVQSSKWVAKIRADSSAEID